MIKGHAFTLIPPVAEGQRQYDFQHEFNRWLRRFVKNGVSDVLDKLDEYDGNYNMRMERIASRRKRR
jgi:hypothetical protein